MIDEHKIRYDYLERLGIEFGTEKPSHTDKLRLFNDLVAECVGEGMEQKNAKKFVQKSLHAMRHEVPMDEFRKIMPVII
jgi:hypothetical protein